MNKTLKAVSIELTGGNVRNHHINLRGAFGIFPEDCLGGNNEAAAGREITLEIGLEKISTDIDETKAIFRERAAIRRFFADENIAKGDLVLVERLGIPDYRISKASKKRALKYYL